jgi:outer membrane lipoprotein-sorting protein
MFRFHGHLVVSLVACCLLHPAPCAVAIEPAQDAFTAEQLLDRMSKAYANCKSYRDSGVVKTDLFLPQGKTTESKPFETAFIRPDRFRFEFCKGGVPKENRYLIWSKGKDVQTWWYVKPVINKPDSLSTAVAAATGVSGSSAHTIPAMLMPSVVQGTRLNDMTGVKRIADAKQNNVDCFRVEGNSGTIPKTVWLDKKTFLVLRIDSQPPVPNVRVEDTTTYEPVIDAQISDSLLVFDPPK